jgi:hypothetical protein
VAEWEFSRRHDVYTLDAYAWALHVNHRDSEALVQLNRALNIGIKDPDLLARAEIIRSKALPTRK